MPSKNPKVPPRLRLAPEWRPTRDTTASPSPASLSSPSSPSSSSSDPVLPGPLLASGPLWDFTEKIASCRREGKNRRDGATVSTRVLSLTDALGRQLQEEAKADKGNVPHRLSREEEETLAKKVKDSRGRKKMTTRANL